RSRMWTGPGPVWATGGAMVTVTEGSAASGSSRGSGAPSLCPLQWDPRAPQPSAVPGGSRGGSQPLLTASSSVSVRFQKLFQKCTSRFCVRRSNSSPRSSGSMANFPLFSPKETRPMAMVCRKGRMEGANCGDGTACHCSSPCPHGPPVQGQHRGNPRLSPCSSCPHAPCPTRL
uniref:Uncharacterized protein n=1 Tax=Strix occidentalis caurina TaxID=311401 RepID=A0A8D0FSF5_STROC